MKKILLLLLSFALLTGCVKNTVQLGEVIEKDNVETIIGEAYLLKNGEISTINEKN